MWTVVALFSSKLYSQVNYSDLRNESGEAYNKKKGPAYFNEVLYTGGVE